MYETTALWRSTNVITKGHVYLLSEFHLTATGCYLPYGITQC